MRETNKIPNIEHIQDLRRSIGWRPRTRKKWKEILQNTRYTYAVYDKNKLVGFGRMTADGVMCMIYDVTVRKEYQGKGIGTKIMLQLLKKVKNKNYTLIGLVPSCDNAAKFYKKLGFKNINAMTFQK